MKNISLMALLISFGVCAQAQAQEIGRYDKKIEKAAAKRAAEKLGSLRGLILTDDENVFIKEQDLQPKPRQETMLFPSPYRKAWEREPGMEALPPMVNADQLDPFVTGSISKFDSDGNPMQHHQDYPRPTPMSAAKSLLEAMNINPFPDDKK